MTGARMLAAGVALAALAGCSDLGNPLDAFDPKKAGPDEFQVLARDELRLPPELRPSTLPEPRPGAPSPLDPDPQAEAVAALTGGRPVASQQGAARISRGEQTLLEAADAAAADAAEAERLAARAAEIEAGQPYQPPTIFQLFGGDEPEIDPELALDSTAEAERLQREGVRAPSDPTVEVEDPDAAAAEAPRPAYSDETFRGRPKNTVQGVLEREAQPTQE